MPFVKWIPQRHTRCDPKHEASFDGLFNKIFFQVMEWASQKPG